VTIVRFELVGTGAGFIVGNEWGIGSSLGRLPSDEMRLRKWRALDEERVALWLLVFLDITSPARLAAIARTASQLIPGTDFGEPSSMAPAALISTGTTVVSVADIDRAGLDDLYVVSRGTPHPALSKSRRWDL